MMTYPFDLERALAGDAVCTVDGEPVYIVGESKHVVDGKTVVGVHEGGLWSWWPDGRFKFDGGNSGLDLRMVTDGGLSVQDELVAALKETREALRLSYNVTDYPADGKIMQDAAMATIDAALAKAGAL